MTSVHHNRRAPLHRDSRSKETIGGISHEDKVAATLDDDDGGDATIVLSSEGWVESGHNQVQP